MNDIIEKGYMIMWGNALGEWKLVGSPFFYSKEWCKECATREAVANHRNSFTIAEVEIKVQNQLHVELIVEGDSR